MLDQALQLIAQSDPGEAAGRIRQALDLLADAESTAVDFATRMFAGLPLRQQQTLEHLLAGNSEKQVARHLNLSAHTVHDYVKSLHRRFNVSSRAELLAKFVQHA